MGQINDTNEKCRKCGRDTIPLFTTGRSRYCDYCEGDKEDPEKTNPNIDIMELEDLFAIDDPGPGVNGPDDPDGSWVMKDPIDPLTGQPQQPAPPSQGQSTKPKKKKIKLDLDILDLDIDPPTSGSKKS